MSFSKISVIALITFLFSTPTFSQVMSWEKHMGNDDTLTTKSIAVSAEGDVYAAGNFRVYTNMWDRMITVDGSNDGFIVRFDKDGNLIWLKQITGPGAAYCTSISVDESGNCFVAGNLWGQVTIGNVNLQTDYVKYDVFIAKFDKDGNFLWAKKAGGSETGTPRIAADNFGGCYVSGTSGYNDSESFGGTSVNGSYLAKYNTDGSFAWVKRIPSGAVSSDTTGKLYIAGSFSGTAYFGGTSVTSSGGSDIFTAKYDRSGTLLWVKIAGGTQADACTSVSALQDGSCYITGSFSQSANFSGKQITGDGGSDVFIAKYDKDGSLLWVKSAGGSGADAGTAVSTDQNGYCYVAGSFSQTAAFGNVQLTSKGSTDIFISKYDKDGNLLWVKQNGGTFGDEALSVAADGNGSCISVYKITAGSETWDKYSYLGKYSDARLVLLSPSGSEQWRAGTKQNVSWTTNLDKVIIELSTNGGTTWVDLTPTPVNGSLGSYSLSVPNKPSANCIIRISSPDSPGSADTSGVFTITNSAVPAIVITSPNGSEKWQIGAEHNITWSAASTGSKLSIEFTKDGGSSWELISDSVSASSASYKWTVPEDTSTQCRIRIRDNSNNAVYDISDNLFKVLPTPKILFPGKASDTLVIADYKEIKWSAPLVKTVDLFYSRDKGKSWDKINKYYNEVVDAPKGTYSWFVPAISTSDSCMLKIVDTEDATVFGETANAFTIYNPITITYPKAGDTLQAGNFYDLTWTANKIKSIKIEYSVLGPASCYAQYPAPSDHCDTLLIKENVRALPYDAALGIYTWIVPDNASPRVRLKIMNVENPLVYAETDQFVISPMPSPDSLLALFASNAVMLSWKDKTDYEEGFKIERKQGLGSYTEIAKVEMNVTSYTDKTIDPKSIDTYSYRIKAYNSYASSPYTEISLNPTSVEYKNEIPQAYALGQNYPNPFNPSTIISFSLPRESRVKLIIYNELGEAVSELLNSTKAAGNHEVSFNAARLASGLYFYSLEASSIDGKDNFRQIKKMLLVK
jgi:hypothetical protein